MTWAVVLCQFRDVATETKSADFFRQFFTSNGIGTQGAFDYWNDLSYGKFVNNSAVFGWFKIPHDSTEISTLSRSVYKQWGFDAANANRVDLTPFPRRIFFFNGNGDHGDCSGGTTVF